jgi:hypothetical protein
VPNLISTLPKEDRYENQIADGSLPGNACNLWRRTIYSMGRVPSLPLNDEAWNSPPPINPIPNKDH